MMDDNLIVIEGENEYHFATKEEFIKAFICEDYYELSKEEKHDKLKMLAFANLLNIKDGSVQIDISNEENYILSILVNNYFLFLIERKDANIFLKEIDKTNNKGEYIIVNAYARELLYKRLGIDPNHVNCEIFPKAYVEVEEILKYVSKDQYQMIDKSLLDMIHNKKDKNYIYFFDRKRNLDEQNMLYETRCVLDYIYENYLNKTDI